MSSNIQNTPMPMMASPLVTSLEQQMHFGGHLMPYPTPISAPTMSTTPQWASELEEEKIFFKLHPPFFLFFSLVAILVGSRDHWTQFWKGATHRLFHQSLVAIGPVVSEEKIFM